MNVRNYDNLLEEMTNRMKAGTNKITDYNTGSIIYTLFQVFSRILEKAYIDTRNGYVNNLRAIPYSVFDFEKKAGSKASVNVQFYRAEAFNAETTIPVGTRISDGAHVFTTTELAKVQAGETESNVISAIAANIGSEYNVPVNTVVNIETNVPNDIIGVKNVIKGNGGADEETDSDALARFKTYINGLQGTNSYGIKAGLLALDNVRSVGIQEHFPPKDNIYNTTVYIDDGSGGMTDELKNEILTIINGDGTSVKPGLRAAGINIEVLSATRVEIAIQCKCKIYRADSAVAALEIKEALQNLIDKSVINQNVVWTDLILKLRSIDYVKDIPELLINGHSNNVEIQINQIARFDVDNFDLTLESAE